jgi:hypothetical protein
MTAAAEVSRSFNPPELALTDMPRGTDISEHKHGVDLQSLIMDALQRIAALEGALNAYLPKY